MPRRRNLPRAKRVSFFRRRPETALGGKRRHAALSSAFCSERGLPKRGQTVGGETGLRTVPLKVGVVFLPYPASNEATNRQEHHHGTYTSMLLTGGLEPHLREIDRQAQEQVDRIVGNLKRLHGIDEALKANNQMAWVQSVNSFIAQAEEMVLPEIVYH